MGFLSSKLSLNPAKGHRATNSMWALYLRLSSSEFGRQKQHGDEDEELEGGAIELG